MTAKLGHIGPLSEPTTHDGYAQQLLSDQVRLTLGAYFDRLDGIEEATDLHALVIGEVEKPLFETVLERCGHNQSKAALVLGISRSTLRKKMAQYGIA